MTFRLDPPDLTPDEIAAERLEREAFDLREAYEGLLDALPGRATPGRRASLPCWQFGPDRFRVERAERALEELVSGYKRGTALVIMARFGRHDAPLPTPSELLARFGGRWNDAEDELLDHRIPGTRLVLVGTPFDDEVRAIVWIVLRPGAES